MLSSEDKAYLDGIKEAAIAIAKANELSCALAYHLSAQLWSLWWKRYEVGNGREQAQEVERHQLPNT